MLTLADTVAKHRERITRQVGSALDQIGWQEGPGGHLDRDAFVGDLTVGLLSRARVQGDGTLAELMRHCLREEAVDSEIVATALVRLAAAIRGVVFEEMGNRRIAQLASAAIDRAVAEVFEELRDDLEGEWKRETTDVDHQDLATTRVMSGFSPTRVDLPAFVPSSMPAAIATVVTEQREPTIIRNINEILNAQTGELLIVTVMAVAFRDGPGATTNLLDPSVAPDALAEREAARQRVISEMKAAGFELSLDHPALVCGGLAAAIGDDDVHRALDLALDLSGASDLEACVGLARGPVLIESPEEGGAPEGNGHHYPTAIGTTLVRAIGLAAAAERREVLCDDEIQRLVATSYVLRPVQKAEDAFALDAEQPRWLERWEDAALVEEPLFVGRAQLLRKLTSALRAPRRKVSVIGLKGRAGSGRHTLLSEALTRIGVSDKRLLRGLPHPLTPAPYWPLISIARQILGLGHEPLQGATVRDRIATLAASSASTRTLRGVLPTLNALIGVEPAPDDEEEIDDAMIAELDPAAMRQEIAHSLRVLLEAAADRAPDRPLVLVLRNVQEMDVPSTHALGHVLGTYDGAAQLVVALTYSGARRPSFGSAVEGEEIPFTEIPVGPMPDADIEALAQSMLDQTDLPAGLGALLARRCGGSPMMAAVLMRYLVEAGGLRRGADGEWRADELPSASEIPRRLKDLVRRRCQRLPPYLLDMLESAATIGESLPERILELVWVSRGISKDESLRAGHLLHEMGFLRRQKAGQLSFSHPLIRDVAYRMLSSEGRRETHGLAFVAYWESYPDAIHQIPALLFVHAIAAGDAGGAREAAVHAARRATLLHDHKQGLAIIEKGLSVCEDDAFATQEARFELLAARERINDARGTGRAHYDERKTDIDELLELAEILSGKGRIGRVMHRLARLHMLAGEIREATEAAAAALDLLAYGDPLDRADALRTMALLRWRSREPKAAATALTEALKIYEGLRHRRGMGFVLHSLGVFFLDTGALKRAHAYLARALAIKEESGDLRGRAAVLDALGQVGLLAHQGEAARECFEQALDLRQQAGDMGGVALSRVSLGESVLAKDPARAEKLARAALRDNRRSPQARVEISANLLLALALLRSGKRRNAQRPATMAAKSAQQLGAGLLLVRARLALAEIHLAYASRARADQATAAAEAAVKLALELGASRWRVEALSLHALAQARIDKTEALRLAKETIATMMRRRLVGLNEAVIRKRCETVFDLTERG